MLEKKAVLNEINFQQVLYYLGYRGQELDDSLLKQINDCIQIIEAKAQPKIVYRIFEVEDGKIDSLPLEGKDIENLLKNAKYAVVFAATIGNDVEKELIRLEVINMANALILDACGSCAIESVCDCFEEEIRNDYKEKKLYVSDRFSPGYGDLPMDSQKLICEMLDTSRQIGVHVTDSYLMTPRKSVTAILAISQTPFVLRKKGCEVCRLFMNCQYRKEGKTCE